MNIIRKRTFRDQEVTLDFVNFVDCLFEGCILIYHGQGETDLTGSQLKDCQYRFAGPALATIQLLQNMRKGGFELPVLNLVNLIFEDRVVFDNVEQDDSGQKWINARIPVSERVEFIDGEQESSEEQSDTAGVS